jgi:hypothetical protein
VTIALTRIERGNLSNTKGVGKGVLEYKIDFGPGYRIYSGQRHCSGSGVLGRLQTEEKTCPLPMTSRKPIGFQALEEQTGIPVKSLMRMLGPKGSPSAANLSSILTVLQKTEGVHFELSLRR